jgi:hypothetical protein
LVERQQDPPHEQYLQTSQSKREEMMKEIKNEYRFTLTHCQQQSKRKELNTSLNSSAGLQKSERAFSRYQVA